MQGGKMSILDKIIQVLINEFQPRPPRPPVVIEEPIDMDATSIRGRNVSTDAPSVGYLYVYDGADWVPQSPQALTFEDELLLGGVPSMQGDGHGIALNFDQGIYVFDEDVGLHEILVCDYSNSTGNILTWGDGTVSQKSRTASRDNGGAHQWYSGNSQAAFMRAQLDDVAYHVNVPMTVNNTGLAAIDPYVHVGLQMESTSDGMLGYRMSEAQRDAITGDLTGSHEGLEIWNLTTHKKNYWDGSAWQSLAWE
jgi:hypothetical protein